MHGLAGAAIGIGVVVLLILLLVFRETIKYLSRVVLAGIIVLFLVAGVVVGTAMVISAIGRDDTGLGVLGGLIASVCAGIPLVAFMIAKKSG